MQLPAREDLEQVSSGREPDTMVRANPMPAGVGARVVVLRVVAARGHEGSFLLGYLTGDRGRWRPARSSPQPANPWQGHGWIDYAHRVGLGARWERPGGNRRGPRQAWIRRLGRSPSASTRLALRRAGRRCLSLRSGGWTPRAGRGRGRLPASRHWRGSARVADHHRRRWAGTAGDHQDDRGEPGDSPPTGRPASRRSQRGPLGHPIACASPRAAPEARRTGESPSKRSRRDASRPSSGPIAHPHRRIDVRERPESRGSGDESGRRWCAR